MADPQQYRYDVFISHSQADQEWVEEWLLPRLEAAGLAVCVDATCFEPGAPIVEETERAIRESRRILVVLSPAWVESQWDSFEALLVHAQDPAARGRRLIPLLLRPCDPPERIKLLQWVDFGDPARQETQLKRVVDAIQGKGALPELRPESAFPSPKQRRWELRWFAVAGVAAVMTLMVLVVFIVWQNQPKRSKTMPSTAFNIAVAEFLSVDAQDKMYPKGGGPHFAQASANYLQAAINELSEPLKQTIRVMGPDDLVFPYEGVSEQNAEEVASKVNAYILVFGRMSPRSIGEWELQLKVFFSEPVVGELAPELSGSFPLGAPIVFANDSTATTTINADIENRLEALVLIAHGLAFFSHGKTDDYEKALSYFVRASESDWGQSSDLAQVVVGYAYLRRDWIKKEYSHGDQAAEAFRKAVEINPDYYGAHNGLGAVLYLKAFNARMNKCWDQNLLKQSYEHRSQALELAAKQANTRMSQLSARLGMGRVLLHMGQCSGDLGTLQAAADEFAEVTKAYTNSELTTKESMLMALTAFTELGYIEMKTTCLAASSENAQSSSSSHERLLQAERFFNQAEQVIAQINTEQSKLFTPQINWLAFGNGLLLQVDNSPTLLKTCDEVMKNVENYIP